MNGIMISKMGKDGRERNVFSGFFDFYDANRLLTTDDDGNEIQSIPLEETPCWIDERRGERAFSCDEPGKPFHKWGIDWIEKKNKKGIDELMEKIGFEFRGYNEGMNGKLDPYGKEKTIGKICIEKHGEKCFLRWFHPENGIKASGGYRDNGDVVRLDFTIPKGKMGEFKKIRSSFRKRGDDTVFGWSAWDIDREWFGGDQDG